MRLTFVTFLVILFSQVVSAETVADTADSSSPQKYTLLNFSGSDWCIPCIKMKKAIFQTDTFARYSATHVTWINADFPRNTKKLDKQQVKQNETLAEKYNSKGSFPYTLLLDEKGNIIKSWDGFPNLTAEQFIQQVDAAVNDHQNTDKTP